MLESGNNPAFNHYTAVFPRTLSSSPEEFFFLFCLSTHYLIIYYLVIYYLLPDYLFSSFRSVPESDITFFFFNFSHLERKYVVFSKSQNPWRDWMSFFPHNNNPVFYMKTVSVGHKMELLFLLAVVTTLRCSPILSLALVTYILGTSGKIQQVREACK